MTDQQLARLTEELRRCSPQTLEAAIQYREKGDSTQIPVVVYGLIERYQPSTSPVRLADASDDSRLIDDLGLDSLTLLELVLSIEECLELRIENEELVNIRTLSELNKFLAERIKTNSEKSS
ncbi:MAG: acyl carrier protein [Verrucomicrobiota bacterium]